MTAPEKQRLRTIERAISKGDYSALRGDGERLVFAYAKELNVQPAALMHQWASSDHRIPGTPGPRDKDHDIPPGDVEDSPDPDDAPDEIEPEVETTEPCDECGGSGMDESGRPCSKCGGTGRVPRDDDDEDQDDDRDDDRHAEQTDDSDFD